jgi:hypothetical protein
VPGTPIRRTTGRDKASGDSRGDPTLPVPTELKD